MMVSSVSIAWSSARTSSIADGELRQRARDQTRVSSLRAFMTTSSLGPRRNSASSTHCPLASLPTPRLTLPSPSRTASSGRRRSSSQRCACAVSPAGIAARVSRPRYQPARFVKLDITLSQLPPETIAAWYGVISTRATTRMSRCEFSRSCPPVATRRDCTDGRQAMHHVWGKPPIVFPSICGGGAMAAFASLGLECISVPCAQADLHEHSMRSTSRSEVRQRYQDLRGTVPLGVDAMIVLVAGATFARLPETRRPLG